MANQIIDVILEFLRISFDLAERVHHLDGTVDHRRRQADSRLDDLHVDLRRDPGPRAVAEGQVRWSRPTQSRLLPPLAAGHMAEVPGPPGSDRLRGCGAFLHTRDDGTYDCRHCGVSARVQLEEDG